jgi:hypothetical protein
LNASWAKGRYFTALIDSHRRSRRLSLEARRSGIWAKLPLRWKTGANWDHDTCGHLVQSLYGTNIERLKVDAVMGNHLSTDYGDEKDDNSDVTMGKKE